MDRKLDALIADTIVSILDKMNSLGVQREDIVNIFQNNKGQYVAIFYC